MQRLKEIVQLRTLCCQLLKGKPRDATTIHAIKRPYEELLRNAKRVVKGSGINERRGHTECVLYRNVHIHERFRQTERGRKSFNLTGSQNVALREILIKVKTAARSCPG